MEMEIYKAKLFVMSKICSSQHFQMQMCISHFKTLYVSSFQSFITIAFHFSGFQHL